MEKSNTRAQIKYKIFVLAVGYMRNIINFVYGIEKCHAENYGPFANKPGEILCLCYEEGSAIKYRNDRNGRNEPGFFL